MTSDTVAALLRLNRRFYEHHAADFSATRQRPWRGWRRLVAALESDPTALRLLDVGCGNGRLGRYLRDRMTPPPRYFGIDTSLPLLSRAGTAVSSGGLICLDVTVRRGLRPASFDLVAAFGLFHHLPSFELRLEVLRYLASLLSPRGALWLSFWQFARERRFERRRIDWPSSLPGAAHPLDASELEPGDHLLRWGPDPAESAGRAIRQREPALRYCHYSDRTETERLIELAGLRAIDIFEEDGAAGNLNLYVSAAPAAAVERAICAPPPDRPSGA